MMSCWTLGGGSITSEPSVRRLEFIVQLVQTISSGGSSLDSSPPRENAPQRSSPRIAALPVREEEPDVDLTYSKRFVPDIVMECDYGVDSSRYRLG